MGTFERPKPRVRLTFGHLRTVAAPEPEDQQPPDDWHIDTSREIADREDD